MRSPLVRPLTVLVALSLLAACARAQSDIEPDVANARYGPQEREVLDVWQAAGAGPRPVLVFFHGGAFRGGDKREHLYRDLLHEALARGMTVVSANYTYSQNGPFPGPMLDGARAVQFVRHHAQKWNIDPDRLAVAGGSAGGGIALWLALHDDLAEAESEDPVARQSTRAQAALGFNAQSTYDPRWIAEHVSVKVSQYNFIPQFYGLKAEQMDTAEARALFERAAPMTYVSADDPAVFMLHNVPDTTPTPDISIGAGIHHPVFGRALCEKLRAVDVACVVRSREDYSTEAGHFDARPAFRDGVKFLLEHLNRAGAGVAATQEASGE